MKNDSATVFEESFDDILHLASAALDASSKLLYSVFSDKEEKLFLGTSVYFEFEDIEKYIDNIRCQDYSDEDDDQYHVGRVIDLSEELREIMIAIKVAAKSLGDIVNIPEPDFVYLNAYLTTIALFRQKLEYKYYKLEEIYKQNEKLWDSIEADDVEETYDLSKSWEYLEIRAEIDSILSYYSEKRYRKALVEFRDFVMKSLDRFSMGTSSEGFSFDFCYRYNEESRYISFLLEDDSITITMGGSAYSPEVGHDSYTNWMFTLWNNGESSGELESFIDESKELIDLGAELSVSEPEEYGSWNKRYSKLTDLLGSLKETGEVGSWVFDNVHTGTKDDPKSAPYVKYLAIVDEVYNGLMDICKENPELEYEQYWETLNEYGIDATPAQMENADVSDKNAKFVIALLIGVYSGERFSDGLIGNFFRKGLILKWIERLEEIDDDFI